MLCRTKWRLEQVKIEYTIAHVVISLTWISFFFFGVVAVVVPHSSLPTSQNNQRLKVLQAFYQLKQKQDAEITLLEFCTDESGEVNQNDLTLLSSKEGVELIG
jgi:hypothetical protein